MKILIKSARYKHSQRGSAVMVLIILLSLMMTLITANIMCVHALNRELNLLEKKQEQQWKKTGRN
jgi:hypothetical protein